MATKKATRLEDARARMYEELIFESAEHVFGEKGFENATMQEIAAEAGVSLKTVYGSFPGKQELYNAIMVDRGRAMLDAVLEAQATETCPRKQLIAGTRAFVGYLFTHQDWSRIHVRSHTSWAVRPKEKGSRTLWDEGQDAHESMLRAGIEAGLFFDDDPTEVAHMIRAMTRVQVVNAIERGEEDGEAIADRLVVRLSRMVCTEAAASD